MITWEHLLMTTDEFKPKVITVFKSFENDLKRIIIPTIPCRIGFIGETSVGKTSLLNCLRKTGNNYRNNSETEIISDRRIFSPVRVGKSTLCQLEFDHEYTDGTQVIFVDIEGSTDYDTDLKSGNYFDEIRKADCDLYILVFDNKFIDIHKKWYDYIVNELKRTCWVVRNKIDDLFLRIFKEDVGQEFNSSSETKRNLYAERIIKRIRKSVSSNTNELKLYLTATSSDINEFNRDLFNASYGKFELEQLINDIKNLPLSFHTNRLQHMCMIAVAKVINCCFRRGYVINVMKYKIYAGLAAVVPFGDLIPRYLGREEIRQVFGVNNRSRFMAWWTGKKDELKEYLENFDIEIDKDSLKTSAFKSTFKLRAPAIASNVNAGTAVFLRPAAAGGITIISLSDDILRGASVGVINTVRGLSFL
ncbi:unnamed protein product [Rotaria sordida]|uniref:G domain-containing protein n=1 Tax=Rotaria sordida TaxID=392033 RepID=A0A818URR7_9BILA|nr:unnamed protein product [Rotaria sordida]CAF1080851.1 unnamed protein product [Rotaria sordida]CAF3695444.1 unnamed protein product [Rotaria sordida]CAF3701895.1 unnamed protein product [Rotaria sordida]